MFLKNKNIIFKTRRSKVTDYICSFKCNNPYLDHVNINAHTKLCSILSICSLDIEWNEIMMNRLTNRMTDRMTDNPNPI